MVAIYSPSVIYIVFGVCLWYHLTGRDRRHNYSFILHYSHCMRPGYVHQFAPFGLTDSIAWLELWIWQIKFLAHIGHFKRWRHLLDQLDVLTMYSMKLFHYLLPDMHTASRTGLEIEYKISRHACGTYIICEIAVYFQRQLPQIRRSENTEGLDPYKWCRHESQSISSTLSHSF